MQEYVCDAVVLNKEPNGDLDSRVSLFSKEYGKLTAKTKSARKITSKLSAHLEPGNLIQVRLVEKNGLQVADALIKRRLNIRPPDLHFLDILLAEAQPEPEVWDVLETAAGGKINWLQVLKILGWDPEHAACGACGKSDLVFFSTADQVFYCRNCALKSNQKGLLYIGDAIGQKQRGE